MYLITWIYENKQKSLKVHTSRAVRDVVTTLQRSDRYKDIQVKYQQPTRVRELVIVFEK